MTTHHCLRCGGELGNCAEKDRGDLFIRCLSCGVRNLLIIRRIHRYRPHSFKGVTTAALLDASVDIPVTAAVISDVDLAGWVPA